MSLSPQWLDELRARITLSAIIAKTVKITRAGREFKACCPFHNEKSPSFTINDEKGFYHCFGCGAHGDAIRWMTDQRGLTFMDAIKELAALAGMEVPAPDPRSAERAQRQSTLIDVTEAAAQWFTSQLEGLDGADARTYLAKRGLRPDIIKTFGLGFAPEGRMRLKTALSKHIPVPQLIDAGMLIKVDDKEPYDRFRGRLMIPIRDARGRVIAFGGRILGDGEPKYLNSPDTPLFDKGRTLYNHDRAAPAVRQSRRVVVVEGYMDVIALTQAGIGDVVAPLGTALTEHQLQMLWRMAPVPLLCFDGDAAGQRAALKAAERALPLLKPGISIDFVHLPEGKDPDDLIRSGGSAAFETALQDAMPLVDKLWNSAATAAPLDTPEQRAALKQRLADYTAAISDPDVAEHYRAEFRERHDTLFFRRSWRTDSQFSRRSFAPSGRLTTHKRFHPDPRSQPPTADSLRVGTSGISLQFFGAIVAGLLRYPDMIERHADALLNVPRPDDLGRLLEAMCDAARIASNQGLDSEALLAILADSPVYNMATALLRADRMNFSFSRAVDPLDLRTQHKAKADLDEAIKLALAEPEIDTALARATASFGGSLSETDFADQQRLLAAKRELTRRLADLAQGDTDI